MYIKYLLFINIINVFLEATTFKGIYNINCIQIDEGNMKVGNNNFLISTKQLITFRIVEFDINKNIYFIESVYAKVRLGINDKNQLVFFPRYFYKNLNQTKMMWEFIQINETENYYLIKNIFNKNLIEINNNKDFQCTRNIESYNFNISFSLQKRFIFRITKYYEEFIQNDKYIDLIKKEPIDILIKYIDLTDISLKREGIKQIDKDLDNEELKYSIRSIFQYIPWIRKIFILMPNEKVRYFKEIDVIDDKIQYINDKEFLGYDTANIHAFTFNLFKLKNFGVSENFIYMEDDFFIGKDLKKSDLFFYNEQSKKVAPLLIQKYFFELNITEEFSKYNKLINIKNQIHPHSGDGWMLSIYQTNLYFLKNFKNIKPIILTSFTHCARVENTKEIETIFKSIQNYKYINETLFSKERHILTLNMPQYENLYQLNVLKKPNNILNYKYILVENLNQENLNYDLFVINTAGNHEPTKRQFLYEKKILQKRYSFKTKYETKIMVVKNIFLKAIYFGALKSLMICILTKILIKY